MEGEVPDCSGLKLIHCNFHHKGPQHSAELTLCPVTVRLRKARMSSEVQRPDDSPSTSGGSSDIEQRESSVPPEQEREQAQPKKKETKISSKTAAKLSTSAKR
ncbi:unnamed protein product [Coregonus sp. 'balchen']|nr:unnamed protein product [Coregonus sp. 'balchen']